MRFEYVYQFGGALWTFRQCLVVFGSMYFQIAAICGQSMTAILVLSTNTERQKHHYNKETTFT